ncbi:mannonate dehydratase [Verrucomicrobiales bacterium BCK34]|nr:mannonate dehydratase [Verrucomicrobiales bacterium BCK34]
MMKLATVLSPLSPENLQLAAQCGVEGVVTRYPGPELEQVLAVKEKIEAHGLKLMAIEGSLPIERIKTGSDHDGRDLAAMKTLIEQMGKAGIPILCYNFMAGTDWVRTQLDAPERGGAKVTRFDLSEAERAISLNHSEDSIAPQQIGNETVDSEMLWKNLEAFLEELVPVAEKAGVTLAMHPDDPPLPEFMGKARIMNSVENFERLAGLVPSPRNAICFCQGSFATMGVDIPDAIRRLGKHIAYVHFRDVRGNPESFVETFHDNGPTDMAEAIRVYREVGFEGPIRPDHVPQLVGEDDGEPGYTILGRLFAFGYIRGLLHGTSQVGGEVAAR